MASGWDAHVAGQEDSLREPEPLMEESGSVEDLHHLRLMALLHELVRKKGLRGAARELNVDRRTVASSLRGGRMSWRVREVLERGLQEGAGSAAARQRRHNKVLEKRLETLEERLESGFGDLRSGLSGQIQDLREEHVRELRRLERRLARVESGREGQEPGGPARTALGQPPATPAWRAYQDLVTVEAEPGEEWVYREATPVVIEWREARRGYEARATDTVLSRIEAETRLLELEVALIEGHGLTLPPATFPWDRSSRRDQIRRRRQALHDARRGRVRALLRLWLRRIVTLGLWRR